MAQDKLDSGEPTPVSGIYEQIDRNGRPTGEQATSTRGKPMPPTAAPGMAWRLVKPARHTGK